MELTIVNSMQPVVLQKLREPKWSSPLRLRGDISLLDKQAVEGLKTLDHPMYVMSVTRWSWYDAVAKYAVNNLDPVYEIIVDDVPILQIYQLNDLSFLQS